MFLTSIEKFYSQYTRGFAYQKNDYILEMKRRVSKIAAYSPEHHPQHIINIKPQLRRLLPSPNHPLYSIYRMQLNDVLNMCEKNSRLKTA
jgi:hypothetical protein